VESFKFCNHANQKDFKYTFAGCKLTIASVEQSILQESVFSSAGATLSRRRKRLLSRPEMIEALVTCRYYLNGMSFEIDEDDGDEELAEMFKVDVAAGSKSCKVNNNDDIIVDDDEEEEVAIVDK
jgi:hypothetical protein